MKRISSGEKVSMLMQAHFGPVLPRLRSINDFDFGWVEDKVRYEVNGESYEGHRVVILEKETK